MFVLLIAFFHFHSLFAKDLNVATPELVKRGKIVFEQNCVMCHGIHGLGDGPASRAINPKPRNFVKAEFKFGNSPAEMFKTVSNGIEGTAMPPWKDALSEEDRWAVIHYERTFNPEKNKVKSYDEMIKEK